ncbi:MAG TPA: hypothetical protein VKP59_05040 [Candidatus Thermoplasmatota archaeon]|nr:hypothetical protein [Candidatus Thermoplasmatota archaeon]
MISIMKINWKYCSIALFTSIGVHGIIITAFFLNYVHQMSSILSNIQQYINTNQENITSAKNALTISQTSEFSPELYIVIFILSFVILSIVVYFFQGFLSSKKAKKN